jgi:hypothetical protein
MGTTPELARHGLGPAHRHAQAESARGSFPPSCPLAALIVSAAGFVLIGSRRRNFIETLARNPRSRGRAYEHGRARLLGTSYRM